MGRRGSLNHKAHHVCRKHKLDEWIWGYKSCIAIPECISWHLSQKSHKYEPPNYPLKAAQNFVEISRLHNWMYRGIKANKLLESSLKKMLTCKGDCK